MQKARIGPKHSLTFRNKYLAVVMSVAAFFLSFSSFGQGAPPPGYAPKVQSYGNWYNRLRADSAQHIPNKACLCKNDNDTTPQIFIYMDTLRGFWNGAFHNIGFGGGSSGTDTIYVTQIGTGSPQVPLLYAVNGNLRTARLVPELYTIPVMNADSGVGIRVDTTMLATWLKIVAQYGPPINGSGANIYNSDGRFNIGSGGTRTINAAGAKILYDSVVDPTTALTNHGSNASRWTLVDTTRDVWLQIGQSTTSGGWKQGMQFDIGGVRSGGLSGLASPYWSQYVDSGRVTYIDQFGNYMLMASTTFGQPGITFNPVGGKFSVYNLPTVTDTTKKPLVYDPVLQTFSVLDSWNRGAGGGGGGASGGFTVQSITSGSSGTVTGGQYIVWFNPASALSAYSLMLPASPTAGQIVRVTFGGTITSGTVITAFTVLPNSGQSILDNTPPAGSSVLADNSFEYEALSTTVWHRHKL